MATVAEHATAQVFALMEELPPCDELAYNRKLAGLWDWVVGDLDFYLYIRYTQGVTVPHHRRQFEKLLKQEPVRQAAVQEFLDVHVPGYERHINKRIEQCCALWRKRLLGPDPEAAKEA